MKTKKNRYVQIIERIFLERYKERATEVAFEREDIIRVAKKLKIKLPKNIGDVLYSFRYRVSLPETIRSKAPSGKEWIIRPKGTAQYAFVASETTAILPALKMVETKIPDSTPGIIEQYALSDEQALLAKVRYNRLLDIFTGVACYSLQSHLRTTVSNIGQVETDEIYVGVDRRGAHYVFPIQAKGAKDRIGIVQIEQDFAVCASKFPNLICRPIATQFLVESVIALFELENTKKGVAVSLEKHYELVPPEELTVEDLENYRRRPV